MYECVCMCAFLYVCAQCRQWVEKIEVEGANKEEIGKEVRKENG